MHTDEQLPQTKSDFWLEFGLALKSVSVTGLVLVLLTAVVGLFAWAFSLKGALLMLVLLLPALGVAGMGILLAKVVLDRLGNREDDYYSKNVER